MCHNSISDLPLPVDIHWLNIYATRFPWKRSKPFYNSMRRILQNLLEMLSMLAGTMKIFSRVSFNSYFIAHLLVKPKMLTKREGAFLFPLKSDYQNIVCFYHDFITQILFFMSVILSGFIWSLKENIFAVLFDMLAKVAGILLRYFNTTSFQNCCFDSKLSSHEPFEKRANGKTFHTQWNLGWRLKRCKNYRRWKDFYITEDNLCKRFWDFWDYRLQQRLLEIWNQTFL